MRPTISPRAILIPTCCLLILLALAGPTRLLHGVRAVGATAKARALDLKDSCLTPPADPVGWFPGDGATTDLSARRTGGALSGGVTYAQGVVGQSYSFDGTGAVVYNDDGLAAHQPLTINAWVRPAARNDGVDFPTNTVSGDNPEQFGHGFGLNVGGGGTTSQLKVEYFRGFRDVTAAHPALTFNAGQWYHVAVVYTSGNVKTYVNGALVDDFNYTQGTIITVAPLQLGRHSIVDAGGTANYFIGQIDEAQVFHRALTGGEVLSIYQATATGQCKPLVVDSIRRAGASPVFEGGSVEFAVSFNRSVTGVDASDFASSVPGSLTGTSVTSVTGSDATRTVNVNVGAGSGAVRIDLLDDDTITDIAGNVLRGPGAQNYTGDESYTVARRAGFTAAATDVCEGEAATFTATATGVEPSTYHWEFPGGTPSSFDGFTPPAVTYTTPGLYDVSLAITVAGLSDSKTRASYINVNARPNPTISVPAAVDTNSVGNIASVADAGAGATYEWTISGGTITAGQNTPFVNWTAGAGTSATLDVTITPASGCEISGTKTVSLNDTVAPAVLSVKRAHPNPTLPNQSVIFNVNFGEDVTGVDASDFVLTRTGANADSAVTNVAGGGRNYSVTVTTGTGSGSIRLDVNDDGTILDSAGNPLGGAGAGNGGFTSGVAYTVFPTLARGLSVEILAPSNALLTEGFCARASIDTSLSAARLKAGRKPVATATVEPPPVVTLRCTSETGLNLTSFDGVNHTFVGEGDFLLTAAKDSTFAFHTRLATNHGRAHNIGAAVLVNSRERMSYNSDDDSYFYGVQKINFPRAGEFIIDFQYGGRFTFFDGDHFRIVSGSGVVTNVNTVDLTLPDLLPASDTGASDTDNLTGVNTDLQFALPYALRAPGAEFDLLRDGAVVATVTSDTNGDATLTDPGTVADGTHAYTIRRHSDGGLTTALNVTVDAPPPSVTSVTRAGADPVYPGASVVYNVTFSRPVTGVDAADFALTTTGAVVGASVSGVSADAGATRTVTVNTGTGAGTLRLDVVDDGTIVGASGKELGGAGAGNGNYAAGEVYTVLGVNIAARGGHAARSPKGATQMLFTVTLSNPAPPGGLTVSYGTAEGGAHPATGGATCGATGVDYVMASGTLPVNAGQRMGVIPVNVCADSGGTETDETLLLNISNASTGVITDAQAVGTIARRAVPGTLLISEVRTSGPGGAGDDFVELYNNSDSPLTVGDTSGGYGLFKTGADCDATPVLVATIPAGTVIPARGHYLLVGSQYSLADYGGAGAAAGDLTLASDLESDANVAVFNTSDINLVSTLTRLDAVGFGANNGAVCSLLSEGSNLPALMGTTTEHSFFRGECDFVGGAGCLAGGNPKDTNDNAADFMFADTAATPLAGVTQRLGAPGPESLTSPIRRGTPGIGATLLDGTAPSSAAPNRVRDFTSDPANNATFGTLSIRRRVTNSTGSAITRLRFRVVELTTFPTPGGGQADLRARSSAATVSAVNDAGTCLASTGSAATPCAVTVQGTTLEETPTQPNGGGVNSTLAAGTITLGTPLTDGASLNVNFLLGIQQTGTFRFYIIIEADNPAAVTGGVELKALDGEKPYGKVKPRAVPVSE